MSQIKNEELDVFTTEFFKLSQEQQAEALKNFLAERNDMAAELEKKTEILAANEGAINALPIVTFEGKKYQFTRAKVSRKHQNTSVELTAEDLAKQPVFIKWAVESSSAILKEVG